MLSGGRPRLDPPPEQLKDHGRRKDGRFDLGDWRWMRLEGRIMDVSEPWNEPGEQGIRGLTFPPTLIDLLRRGRWKHPGDDVMQQVMPWFEDPLDFLTTVEHLRRESRHLDTFADDDEWSSLYRVNRGSASQTPVDLPWLDADQAVLIAVNRIPGDDTFLALDYRENMVDPRVVAADIWSTPNQYHWRIVAPTLGSFAGRLGLCETEPAHDLPAESLGPPEGRPTIR
jgi:hypothetical protein